MNAVDDAEKMLFLVFSPDSTQVELFFSEEEMPNEILERRGLPAVCARPRPRRPTPDFDQGRTAPPVGRKDPPHPGRPREIGNP